MAGDWWPRTSDRDLVGYLAEDELARLFAASNTFEVAAGGTVLRKGSPSRSVLLVETGEVAVVEEALGERVVLASVGVGGVVGEVGFVDGEPRTHDVVAVSACRLRSLDRERLLELVKGDPLLFAKLTIALAELLARRFRSVAREIQPLRAFAASLQEPMEDEVAGASAEEALDDDDEIDPETFDEIDEEIPEDALAMIRDIAKRAEKNIAGT